MDDYFCQMSPLREYLVRRAKSFTFAFRGIGVLFATQANARIHLVAMLLIVVLGASLDISATEWCFIFLCIGLVLAAEALNSALEFLTDLASPDFHPLAQKAKDLAAGAVLLSVIFSGIVWGIIHVPKLLALWSGAPVTP